MSFKCVVKGCATGSHLFRFPGEYILMWCENLQITKDSLNTRTRVCNLHFRKECLLKKRLKIGSIPTLNLGHNGIAKHPHFGRKPIKRRCCVRNCYTASADTILYSFPPGNGRKEWLDILKLNDNNTSLWICGLHFRPSFVKRKYLLPGAYPEFHLGTENIDPMQEFHLDKRNNEPLQEFHLENENNDSLQESADPLAEITAEEQRIELNCSKCKFREARCSELKKEIEAVRLKIDELTEKCYLHRKMKSTIVDKNNSGEEHEVMMDEEFIWLIIN